LVKLKNLRQLSVSGTKMDFVSLEEVARNFENLQTGHCLGYSRVEG